LTGVDEYIAAADCVRFRTLDPVPEGVLRDVVDAAARANELGSAA